MTDSERAKLALEVFDCIFWQFESFREDNIGADLAYLMGAILGNSYVGWSKREYDGGPPVILKTLQDQFKPDNILWSFIQL